MTARWYRNRGGAFQSTVPARRRCPHCRRLTLAGWDGGIPYVVDFDPIARGHAPNRGAELAVLLRGGWTFDRLVDRTLRRRTAGEIAAQGLGDVYGEHACPEGSR